MLFSPQPTLNAMLKCSVVLTATIIVKTLLDEFSLVAQNKWDFSLHWLFCLGSANLFVFVFPTLRPTLTEEM